MPSSSQPNGRPGILVPGHVSEKAPGKRARFVAAVVAAVSSLLAAGPARAEGPGFKISDSLVLHLGASLGAGYDSNVFYSSGDTTGCSAVGLPTDPNRCDPARGAAYLSFRPTLDIATNPVQRGGNEPHALDFRLHLGLPLRFLLSTDPTLNQHYTIGAEGGLLLSIFPFGEWTVDLFDNFVRTSEPPYALVRAAFVGAQAQNINNDQNQLGLRIRYRPGGGRLEATLQYTLGISYYESSPVLTAKSLLWNDFQLRLRWNFFPKTGVYINISETTNNYVWGGTSPNTPPPAYPFRAVAGLIGLITPKLSVNLNVGYGNSFTQSNASYPNSPSYNLPIGLAELEWRPGATTILALGFRHDFSQALIGTYYMLDTAYINYNQQIWRLVGNIKFAWERRQYEGNLTADSLLNGRVDNILALHVGIDLPIKDYLIISIGDDLAKDFSNCRLQSGAGVVNALPCDYLRNDVWLRLALAY